MLRNGDALGRLTRFKDSPTDAIIDAYGYDKTGNRTSVTTAAGTSSYIYPADSHRLAAVAGVPRTYDAAGNTTSIGGDARQFTYDDTGRMSSVQVGGATARQYAYNGKGERVHSYLGADHIYTLYDESGHWIGDYDASAMPIQQAIWMDDLPVGLRTAAAGTLSYIEPDHLGSPRVVIDPVADKAIWRWDLKGEVFGATAPEQDPDGDGIGFRLDMRFPGQRYDAASGLNQNGFRDYDTGSGRYIQSDPVGLEGGISTYGYVSSNPMDRVDPFGLAETTVTAWCRQNPQDCALVAAGTTAAAAVLPKADVIENECPDIDVCRGIVNEIKKTMQEINGRAEAMLVDRCNMYKLARYAPNSNLGPTCPGSWRGHGEQIQGLQNRLKNLISQALRNRCEIPFGAFAAAYRGLPNMPRGY